MPINYEERVRNAALMLDAEVPGWENLIDEDKLLMSSCSRCVLGQVFGAPMEERLAELIGPEKSSQIRQLRAERFTIGASTEGYGVGTDYLQERGRSSRGKYPNTNGACGGADELRCLWIKEIADRRAANESSD